MLLFAIIYQQFLANRTQKESIMADLSTLKIELKNNLQASHRFQSELLDILRENAVDTNMPEVKSALSLGVVDPDEMDFEAGPSIALLVKTQ
jgi:hypothetical protein